MWNNGNQTPQPGHRMPPSFFSPRGPTPLLGTPRYPPLLGPRGPRPPPHPSQFYPPPRQQQQPFYRGGGGPPPGHMRGGQGSPRSLMNQQRNGYSNEYGRGGGPPQPLLAGGYGGRPNRGYGHGGGRSPNGGKKRKRGGVTASAGGNAESADVTAATDSDNQAKVLKKDKAFFCDTCDRGFDTRDKLDEHYGTHYHCDRPGCRFEAHPKIVELHVQMQHETGFAEKIMSLDTAEQIEKWRRERKKNFPSAEGIAKRQAEQEAMISRGELLTNLAYFSPQSKRGQQQQRGGLDVRGRGGRGRGGPPHPPYRPLMAVGCKPPYPPPLMRWRMWGGARGARSRFSGGGGRNRGGAGRGGFKSTAPTAKKAGSSLNKFEGTATTHPATNSTSEDVADVKVEADDVTAAAGEPMDTGDQHITDSEGEMGVMAVTSTSRTKEPLRRGGDQPVAAVPKALLSLMSAYQSETEPESEEKESHPGPSTAQASAAAPARPARRRTKPKPPQKPGFVRPPPKKRIGLLERLLANEIRHERNVILQCVHHVVEKNFFGIGQQPKMASTVDSFEQLFLEPPADSLERSSGNPAESVGPPSSDPPADSLERPSSDPPVDSLELSFELPADSLEQLSAEIPADYTRQLTDSLEQPSSELPVDSLDRPYSDPLANSLEQISFELPDDSLEQSCSEPKVDSTI